MDEVTDAAFRQILAKYGKPDVMWTEFVSCDGLCSRGRENLLIDLQYKNNERPIIVQIFGNDPDLFFATAQLLRKMKFDGIDINMGCPEKSICKNGKGAAMIKDPANARACIRATIEGGGLPVSVKTRIGFSQDELDNWLPELLKEDLSAVVIHARTRKEMSKVPANWRAIKRAVKIRDSLKHSALIIGNGDVKNLAQGYQRVVQTGCDGVMIGRATFGNPWIFNRQIDIKNISLTKRFAVMVEHAKLFEKYFGQTKNFAVMKKYFKAYVSGFAGAKELRMQLMAVENAKQVEKIVKVFLKSQS
ncbi:MAG: tRNA-dihydrouridine synthase, partial [Patescibacteria group bacterium]|jgi:nifR3 family TIM-barrel protein|nr:tRNA-dihydrouridine synthase [Patescibacteria group bacterium]